MKSLFLLVVNLLVTTILAENNVHPKLKVREINSRNGYVGTVGDQKEMEEHLRNIQKHLSEASFNLKEIKSNDNFQVKNSPKRYKIKISSRVLKRNDLPITEHGKTKKYKIVLKRKGVGRKNISAVNVDNIIKQIKDANDLIRRDNGASKNYRRVYKQRNASIEDLENVSQKEDGEEHLVLDTAEIKKYESVNETRLDQNNASIVNLGYLLSQFTDKNYRPLTENAEKKENKPLSKLKSNEQEIESAVDTVSDRQPEYKRLKTYWKPQYYNQDSQSYYDDERPETGYTNIMFPNQQGSVQYIPFKHKNLLLRPRQDTKIRYIYQQDGKRLVPYKWTETENPTDRLLLKLDSDSDKVFKHHYVIEPGNNVYNVPVEQTIKYIGTPNKKPIDWNNIQIFNSRPNVPLDYEYIDERSNYNRDTSIYYNPSQMPDPTNKGYLYKVLVPFDLQNTVESRYTNQNELNKQRPAHFRDYDNYNPYSVEIPKDQNQNIQLLRPDLLQDYKNVNFRYENTIPTDSDVKEPVYLDTNRENKAITQPHTKTNGPESNFDSRKVISDEIDYNDEDTKENQTITQPHTINNGPETNFDSKVISEGMYYHDKETKESIAIPQPQTVNNGSDTNFDSIKVISEAIDYNDKETKESTAITQPQTINTGTEMNFDSIKVVSEEIDYNDKETTENTATTQPHTINNGPETNFDSIKFISEEIDYNDKETKGSSNETVLNVIPIHQVKNENRIEHPIIDNREDEVLSSRNTNKEKGKFPSDVDFYEIQTQSSIKPDETKIKISPIDDVLDLCVKLNVDALVKKINLNPHQPKCVADLEKFQKLLEQFVTEQPDSPLRGVVFKLLINIYLVLQEIENPSKSLDTNIVDSIRYIMEQTVKSIDNQNTDILEVIQQAVKDLEKPTESTNIKPQNEKYYTEQERKESLNSYFIFENPVTVNPTLDTISVAPQNIPKSGSQKDDLLLKKEVLDIEQEYKPVENQSKLPQNPLADTISFDKSQKSSIEIFADPTHIYNIKEQNPVIRKILKDLDINTVTAKNIVTIKQENYLNEPDYADKQVQIEVDEQHPFDHKYFEELLDLIKDNLNLESVKKYKNFDKELVIHSIPNSGKSEVTFWEDPDKDLVPANNEVAIKLEQGLYAPEQESGLIPESENIDGPNHQRVSIPKQPMFDKEHPAYNEYFELMLDPEILTNFEDSANKPVTERIPIPETNVLIPELVNKSEESGSSVIYIQPIRVENIEDLIPPIGETVQIEPETRILIPEQIQYEEDKQDPVYYEYFEELLDPKKDNLSPESIKNYEDSDIKPVTYRNPVSENSKGTFDLNPNESNRTWNQIDTKPIEYVAERYFDIPKQVKSNEDEHYPGKNDYYEIPRTNSNKAPVTNDITPENSKEVTFTNSKDPVLALLRELESDADSNEDDKNDSSDKNVNSIDYDFSLKRILEVLENLGNRLRKYDVPGGLIKKIIKKVLIITIRKLEENDITCSERVQFDRFVSLLKRDVGNINFSSDNDTVNVNKDELKQILRLEEMVQLLRQLLEPRLLLVARVNY